MRYTGISIHMQVNNNGVISFQSAVSAFTPESFPLSGGNAFDYYEYYYYNDYGSLPDDLELIAPYWADVDTSPPGTGTVWYRETSEPLLLDRAASDIQAAFVSQGSFVPTYLLIATWDGVSHFGEQTNLVSAFCIIIIATNTHLFIVLHLFDCLDQHIPVCDGN